MHEFMLIGQGILIILTGPYQTPAKTTTNIQKKQKNKINKNKTVQAMFGFYIIVLSQCMNLCLLVKVF